MNRRIPGTPCWAELGGPADAELLDHYARLLGWEFGENRTVSGYQRGFADGEKVAGFGGPSAPRPVRGWRGYLSVDDLDAVLSDAKSLGADAASDIIRVGPDGRFAWILDPGGAFIGLFEPDKDPGTSRVPGPGRIVDWVLDTIDRRLSTEFHANLFPDFHDQFGVNEGSGPGGWRPVFAANTSDTGDVTDPRGNIATLAI
jgi:uncharacterized protein